MPAGTEGYRLLWKKEYRCPKCKEGSRRDPVAFLNVDYNWIYICVGFILAILSPVSAVGFDVDTYIYYCDAD